MQKKVYLATLLASAVVLCSCANNVEQGTVTQNVLNEQKVVMSPMPQFTTPYKVIPTINPEVTPTPTPIEVAEEPKKDERPRFKDIPLDDNLQQYIYDQCNAYGVSYTLMLAIAEQESKFDVNIPESPTHDLGLFQINRAKLDPRDESNLADLAGIKNVKPTNPYHNSKMAIAHIKQLTDYWTEKVGNDSQVMVAVLVSYNRGLSGGKRYIQNHGFAPDNYVKKVKSFKIDLESNIN